MEINFKPIDEMIVEIKDKCTTTGKDIVLHPDFKIIELYLKKAYILGRLDGVKEIMEIVNK